MGIGDLDPIRWPKSHWRSLKVRFKVMASFGTGILYEGTGFGYHVSPTMLIFLRLKLCTKQCFDSIFVYTV